MTRDAYRDEIKFKVSGGLIELEISDQDLDKIIDHGMREIQRYMDAPIFKTIAYEKCIDLQTLNIGRISRVDKVLRTSGLAQSDSISDDPMLISQWQMIGGIGNIRNFQDAMDNYLAWNTILRIRNTTSTDLAYTFDENDQKLYINISTTIPDKITIAVVPQYLNVEDIKDDYWIDTLMQMCVALTKIALGRIRTRFTQSNALWQQDGATILQEGLDEYKQLQDYLRQNMDLTQMID